MHQDQIQKVQEAEKLLVAKRNNADIAKAHDIIRDAMAHHGSSAKVCAMLRNAEAILNEWLCDNTEEVFEEEPEVDAARCHLLEALGDL